MRRSGSLFLISAVLLAVGACQNDAVQDPTGTGGTQQTGDIVGTSVADAMEDNARDHEDSDDYSWNSTNATEIVLGGDVITVDGTGVAVENSIATITSGGNYVISGTLNDGQILVDSDDGLTVRLILNSVDITSTTNAPISVSEAEKTIIILADGSHNYVTDGSDYVFDDPDDDEPNAAVFSKDDLSVYGNGSLTIDANYNDGLASKDGLVIRGGTINISAVDDGIRGKDYLVIRAGAITVNAGGDALKSDNDDDADMGYILVEDGEIDITCDADGLDAETDALITGGTLGVTTGGGSSVTPGEDSAKGIKGGKWVVIDDGVFDINSSDDAIHSNSRIAVNEGVYTISTGDDGIHADSSLVIDGGTIDIERCVEGIESSVIAVNGGDISVVASDDCFNSTAGMRTEVDDKSCTYICGGYIVLNTNGGDGLDSNGSIVMTDGTVIIHGPSNSPEIMFDYNGTFNIDGGLLVSSGSSSHMTQAPSSTSTQNSLKVMFGSPRTASTLFHIEDSEGADILTFRPVHRYQSIVFSSSGLVGGRTYSVYLGGASTGENTNGLYTGGIYSGGVKTATFTVSGTITSINM